MFEYCGEHKVAQRIDALMWIALTFIVWFCVAPLFSYLSCPIAEAEGGGNVIGYATDFNMDARYSVGSKARLHVPQGSAGRAGVVRISSMAHSSVISPSSDLNQFVVQ